MKGRCKELVNSWNFSYFNGDILVLGWFFNGKNLRSNISVNKVVREILYS